MPLNLTRQISGWFDGSSHWLGSNIYKRIPIYTFTESKPVLEIKHKISICKVQYHFRSQTKHYSLKLDKERMRVLVFTHSCCEFIRWDYVVRLTTVNMSCSLATWTDTSLHVPIEPFLFRWRTPRREDNDIFDTSTGKRDESTRKLEGEFNLRARVCLWIFK